MDEALKMSASVRKRKIANGKDRFEFDRLSQAFYFLSSGQSPPPLRLKARRASDDESPFRVPWRFVSLDSRVI
jgi:hypothetical protein